MEDTSRLERVRQIAKHVNNIPTLPSVMTKVIELVEDPKTTAPQLARFISNDPALTAKILKLANSAFYGFPQKIGTINLAIVVLGLQSVKDLGLSAAVVETFSRESYQNCFNLNQFWVHTIAVAAGCKILTQERNYKIAGEIFVAGLLHDIGKLLLCYHMPDDYARVMQVLKDNGKTAHEAELEIFGFSHADAGGWLIEQWNLPSHLAFAVYDHPHPWNSSREPNLAMLVNFANVLARRGEYSVADGEIIEKLHPEVEDYLKLKRDDQDDVNWDYYLKKLDEEMSRAKGFLFVLREGV